jgi:putative holliday junction resolvase
MTLPPSFPDRGRLAGIDFGTVRVGVALCDPDRILASPYATYARGAPEADARYFRQLAVEERLVGFVVGLPLHMSGDPSEKSRQAEQFGAWLGQVTGLPVAYQDERFTTADATEALLAGGLRRHKVDRRKDMVAAQAILARFLATGS